MEEHLNRHEGKYHLKQIRVFDTNGLLPQCQPFKPPRLILRYCRHHRHRHCRCSQFNVECSFVRSRTVRCTKNDNKTQQIIQEQVIKNSFYVFYQRHRLSHSGIISHGVIFFLLSSLCHGIQNVYTNRDTLDTGNIETYKHQQFSRVV